MMRTVLLFLALIALTSSARAAPPDWGTEREVEIRLSGLAFTPSRIELDRGAPVRLVLVNDPRGARSFSAPRFFAGAEMPAADRAKLRSGGVGLKPGERIAIRLVPPAPGTYNVRSGRLLQAALGMTGEIVVR